MNIILILFILLVNLEVKDYPNDSGDKLNIKIFLSHPDSVLSVKIFREEKEKIKELEPIKILQGQREYLLTDKEVERGKSYSYILEVEKVDGKKIRKIVSNIVPKAEFFHKKRLNVLVFLIFYSFFLFFYLGKAKKGEALFLRKIPGLDAVDEAVGRSTEMGRPLLYILGLGYISDIATLAGLSILGRVAKKVAEYESDILVPCYDPIVMAAAQEITKQGYMEAGRPDLYKEKNIFFLTQDQFGYAAGVDGIMLREKPGAIFFQGYFYAESLILAETGYSIGAIQIAGTTAITQLPFFIAACDYTLIGEEMFAASAYLTRDPLMVSTIKGEDVAKMFFMGFITLGTILGSLPILSNLYNLIMNFLQTF